MAYTCNLLLHTLPAIEHQEKADDKVIVVDLERPGTRDRRPEMQDPHTSLPAAHGHPPGPRTPDIPDSRGPS